MTSSTKIRPLLVPLLLATLTACSGGTLDTGTLGGGGPGDELQFTHSSLPIGVEGHAYLATLDADGGQPPYQFAIVGGDLPSGLEFQGDTLAGTPAVDGSRNLRFRVTDSATPPAVDDRDFLLDIRSQGSLVVSTNELPDARVGVMYEAVLRAVGGTAPYAFSIIAGALPPGITLEGDRLSGVPTNAVEARFEVRVDDLSRPPLQSGTHLAITVTSVEPLAFSPATLPVGVSGQSYDQQFVATGGNPPHAFRIASGNLPGGLALNGDRLIGTPSSSGVSRFVVELADSSTPTLTLQRSYDLSIRDPLSITTSSLSDATVGTPYSATLAAAGGVAPYAFDLVEGTLPAGIQLDSGSGLLSGTATTQGLSQFRARVTDSEQSEAFARLSLTVVSGGGASDPVPSITANRIRGPAPLPVFFDATATTSPVHSNTFHHLQYGWNFADTTARISTAIGPLASHVFETPGTYVVGLSVIDPDGRAATTNVTITVEDPDVVYPGSSTICFSNSGDFTGAPAGAQQVTTTSFDSALSQFGPDRRLLFKRGDRFAAGSTRSVFFDDAMIGAFGAATNVDARGIAGNNPVITTQGLGGYVLRGHGSGIVVADLNCELGSCDGMFEAVRHVDNMAFVHVKTRGGSQHAMIFAHTVISYYGDPAHDSITWWESDVANFDRYAVYAGGTRMAWVGSRMMHGSLTHVVRIPYAVKLVIADNEMGYPEPTRHIIKLHAKTVNATLYGDRSEQAVISRNRFESDAVWPISIEPQNAQSDERVHDVIADSNTSLITGRGILAYRISAQGATLRNNVVVADGTTSVNQISGIHVARLGVEPAPANVDVHHNTFYTSPSSSIRIMLGVFLGSGSSLSAFNNLAYAPGRTYSAVDAPAGGATSGNLDGVDPRFVDAASSDFRLTAGSPAVDHGVDAKVRSDHDGNPRPAGATPDVGAFER